MAKKMTNTGATAELKNSLLLHHFMLSLLKVYSLNDLIQLLDVADSEGKNEKGETKFYAILAATLADDIAISRDKLQEYDRNIVRHTDEINSRRIDKVCWKHFQYLQLLIMEIYLDKYFADAEQLAEDINDYRMRIFMNDRVHNYTSPFHKPIEADELRKVAVWCATGSGKTLLMHINLMQVLHYARKYHRKDFDNVLLVTPKEGLTRQHLDELEQSGIDGMRFSHGNASWTTRDSVQVIEVTKLKDENGPTTVDVATFEENNLVLVDEAHNAQGGDTQKPFRDRLSKRGFCIEYSATLGQAVDNANGTDNRLMREYGISTIFDYSYRHFYNAGFGKEFETCNIDQDIDDQNMFIYEVGGLMGFYEQQLMYSDHAEAIAPLQIAPPLAIFIGHTVSASDTSQEVKELMSDVAKVVKMIARFLYNESGETVDAIDSLMKNGLLNGVGKNVFENYFGYLKEKSMSALTVYQGMLDMLFNGYAPGSKLVLDNLRGVEGEIALYTAGNAHKPFGVINVGKPADVTKACSDVAEIRATDFISGTSMFDTVNDEGSTITMLIGAKKFTEGWSSWRVSTMCLMNVGKSKGSEIIQLFGRGVRLKGVNLTLKRTSKLLPEQLPDGLPNQVNVLETLRIFGMNSKYVSRFEEEIKKADIKPDYVTIKIKQTFTNIEERKLHNLREPEDANQKFFAENPRIDLDFDNDRGFNLILDRYPKAYHYASGDSEEDKSSVARKNEVKLSTAIETYPEARLINRQRLWLDLRQYKLHQGFYNIFIDRDAMWDLLWKNDVWYQLYASDEYLKAGGLKERVERWQDIALSLLKIYLKAFFTFHKKQWLSKHIKVDILKESDVMRDHEYRLVLTEGQKDRYKLQLEKIAKKLEEDLQTDGQVHIIYDRFKAVFFKHHLYQPLLTYPLPKGAKQEIPVSPVALNESETYFLTALMEYCGNSPLALKDCEMYLLRNKSKAGTGFFTNQGFFPDFIVWIIKGGHKWITFVEPHGMVYENDVLNCDKVKLAESIKGIADAKKHHNLTLNSYIITPTPIKKIWPSTAPKNDKNAALDILHKHHLYAAEEGWNNCVKAIVEDIVSSK